MSTFRTTRSIAMLVLAATLFVGGGLLSGGASTAAQSSDDGPISPLEPLDTSSPQATYLSFLDQVILLEDLVIEYERNRTEENQSAFGSAIADTSDLFDLSDVSSANSNEAAASTFANLADVLNRLPLPDVDEIPDADDVAEAAETIELSGPSDGPADEASPVVSTGGLDSFTIPGSEISIVRLEEGRRAGDYVFSTETVASLPGWRDEVDGLPVNEGVRVSDWVQKEADFTGHLVPRSLVNALPDSADATVLGTPLWKVIVDILILGVVGVVVVVWQRLIGRRGEPGTASGYGHRLTTPVLAVLLVTAARRFMEEQVNHSGDFATFINLVVTAVIWGSFAWAFFLATRLVVEWLIASPRISDRAVDANLLRLLGKVVSVGGLLVIAWIGLSRLGVSTVGLSVGAGVLGLAVGLAATGTLENLIGGVTLYADKPFAVDDTVTIDGDFGVVEEIGPRATSIRKLDDTRVTLPNSDVSRVKITNYSERRHIQFLHVVGVRYETSIDQLRTIVAAIDGRLREHPRVTDEADFPRVRVVGFGASSIDIEVRARVDTQSFAEFQGIQQELLLLIFEVVDAAGTGFAFPSTTTYLADDTGLPEPHSAHMLVAAAPSTSGKASIVAGADDGD